jgi:hypothetical protein
MNEVRVLGRQGSPASGPVRTLKIEPLGDPWRGKLFSGIRLKGRWLVRAGFRPGQRVTVTVSSPGSMHLRIVPEPQTAEPRVPGQEQTPLALEFPRGAHDQMQPEE